MSILDLTMDSSSDETDMPPMRASAPFPTLVWIRSLLSLRRTNREPMAIKARSKRRAVVEGGAMRTVTRHWGVHPNRTPLRRRLLLVAGLRYVSGAFLFMF